MENIVHISILFLLLSTFTKQIQSTISLSTSKNYRFTPDPPIDSNPYNYWILLAPQFDNTWVIGQNIDLPMSLSNDQGLVNTFQIEQQAYYVITIQIDNSGGLILPQSFSNNSVILPEDPSNPNPTKYQLTYYYTEGQHQLRIWMDSQLTLVSFSVQLKTDKFDVSLDCSHNPSLNELIIKTNIEVVTIPDLLQFVSKTKIQLQLKDLQFRSYDQCINSLNGPYNPMNFAGYTSQTNLTLISQGFSLGIIDSNHPYSDDPTGKYVVILVSNILIDCTVHPIISFPSLIQQTYFTNYTITAFSLRHNFNHHSSIYQKGLLFKVNDQKVSVMIRSLRRNYLWNFVELKKKMSIKINDTTCVLEFLANWQSQLGYTQTQFYCKNQTEIFTNSKVSQFTIPDYYLINNYTKQLQKFEFNTWSNVNMEFEFTIKNSNVVSMIYFQINQTLDITFDITTYNHWDRQNIRDLISTIKLDGSTVTIQYFHFVENSQQKYIISGKVPYITVDSQLHCYLKGGWFETNDLGHHLNWINQNATTAPLQYIRDQTGQSNSNEESNSNGGNSQNEDDSTNQGSTENTTTEVKKLIVSDAVYQSVVLIQNFANGAGMLLFNYLINSLVAFKDLSFLFYFVEFKYILNHRRNEISSGVILLEDQDGVIGFVNSIFGSNIKVEPPSVNSDQLQNIPVGKNYNRLWDFGYFSNFLNNNFDGLLMIAIAIVKILLIFLISRIPVRFLRRFLTPVVSIWKELLLTQFVMMSPPLFLIFTSHFSNIHPFEVSSFNKKSNLATIILFSFFCAICCFVLYLTQIGKIDKKIKNKKQISNYSKDSYLSNKQTKRIHIRYGQQKTKKINFKEIDLEKQQSLKEEQEKIKQSQKLNNTIGEEKIDNSPFSKQFLLLIDNSMYFLIPFCVGIGSPAILVLVGTVANVGRLVLIGKRRNEFSRGQFVRQILSKSLWTAFTTVYLIYWVFEILQLECSIDSSCYSVLTTLDLAETFLFLGGCILQIVLGLITIIVEIILQLKKIISHNCRNLKIEHKVQDESGDNSIKKLTKITGMSIKTVSKVQSFSNIKFKNPFNQLNLGKTIKSRKINFKTKKDANVAQNNQAQK